MRKSPNRSVSNTSLEIAITREILEGVDRLLDPPSVEKRCEVAICISPPTTLFRRDPHVLAREAGAAVRPSRLHGSGMAAEARSAFEMARSSGAGASPCAGPFTTRCARSR